MLSLNPFSLCAATDLGHTYQGQIEGVTLYLIEEGEVFFPPREQVNQLEASRIPSIDEHAYAVLALGIDQVGSCVDANEFYTAYGHANEGLLRNTAARMGVSPKGKPQRCSGCLQAKGSREAIPSFTSIRSDRKLGRVFIDLSGSDSS